MRFARKPIRVFLKESAIVTGLLRAKFSRKSKTKTKMKKTNTKKPIGLCCWGMWRDYPNFFCNQNVVVEDSNWEGDPDQICMFSNCPFFSSPPILNWISWKNTLSLSKISMSSLLIHGLDWHSPFLWTASKRKTRSLFLNVKGFSLALQLDVASIT